MSDSKKQLFEDLIIKHRDNLYGKATGLVNNVKLAEELVQQTCKLAYRRFENFEKKDDFEKWLIRILIFIWARTDFQKPLSARN